MKFGGWQRANAEYAKQLLYRNPEVIISEMEEKLVMKEANKRSIFRWIHIIFGIPIIGYIYDSPTDTPNYAWSIRYVLLPVLLISGLWMWKGHVVRRLLSRKLANQVPHQNGTRIEV
jgi:hypothetical protein